jgi:large subunit ribosomal protein L19
MSTAIACTRASVPRATFKIARCRRFASTETVAVAVDSALAPILSTKRPKKILESLGAKMHRLLYPDLYKKREDVFVPKERIFRAQERRAKPKHISAKWEPTMRQKGVQTNLSKCGLWKSLVPRNRLN